MIPLNILLSGLAYFLLFFIAIRFFDKIFVNRKCRKNFFCTVTAILLLTAFLSTVIIYIISGMLSFNLLTGIGGACLLSLLYEPKLQVKLLYSLLLIVLAVFSLTAALYGLVIFTGKPFPDFIEKYKLWFFFVLVCSLSIFWLLSSLTARFTENTRAKIPVRYILLLFTVPLISVVGIIQIYNEVSKTQGMSVMLRFVLLVCILYVNLTEFYLFGKLADHLQQTADIQSLQQQLQIQGKFYERLESNQNEIRKIRHDMKHRLEAIHILFREKQYDHMEEELSALLNDVYVSRMVNSGNPQLDAILNIELNEARQMGIQVETDIFVASTLQLTFSDLCVLLGNSFDNAMEACSKMPDVQRKIHLEMSHVNHAIYISLTNPFSQGTAGEKLETTKEFKKNHGIGLKSIRYIAEKYSGSVRTLIEGDQFNLTIVLQDAVKER